MISQTSCLEILEFWNLGILEFTNPQSLNSRIPESAIS